MYYVMVGFLSLSIGFVLGHLLGYTEGYLDQKMGVEHDEMAAGRIPKTKKKICVK